MYVQLPYNYLVNTPPHPNLMNNTEVVNEIIYNSVI